MINLLPEPARERAAIEYRVRLGAVAALFAGLGALLAAGLLLPAYFLARVAREAALTQKAAVTDSLAKENLAQAAAQEQAAEALYSAVHTVSGTPRPSAVIDILLAARPAGVVVGGIRYANTGGAILVGMSGVAPTRDALLAFKQALADIGGISKVDLPLSDLIKSNDIPFNITASYVPPAPASAGTQSGAPGTR